MKVMSIIAAVAGAIFRVVVAVAVVYLIYKGTGICYDYGYRIFTEPAMSTGEGRTVSVTVSDDMSALEIGELFESRGLVRDARLFMVQYYLSEYVKDVKPGTYELSTAMTVEDMMAVMAETEDEDADESASRGQTSGGGNASSESNPPAGGSEPEGEENEGAEQGEDEPSQSAPSE